MGLDGERKAAHPVGDREDRTMKGDQVALVAQKTVPDFNTGDTAWMLMAASLSFS